MRIKYFTIIRNSLFFITAILLVSCSNTNQEVTVTDWQVLFSMEASPAKVIKNTEWEKIKLPRLVLPPYQEMKGNKYLWMRGKVLIKNPRKWYGIALGRVYCTDTTYINNRHIGELTYNELHELHRPRHYKIPSDLLHRGENEVLIRIGTFGSEHGGIDSTVRVMTEKKFIRHRVWTNFLFVYCPLGILFFFLGPFIFSIIMIAQKKDTKSNMLMLAILVSWMIYLLAVYSPWFPFDNNLRITILWCAVSLMPILFFLFIQSHYRTFVISLNKVLLPILVAFGLTILIFNDPTSAWYPGRVLGLATLILTVPAHLYLLYYLNIRKPGNTALYLFLFGIIPIAGFIGWDIVNYIFISHVPPMVHIYFLPPAAVLYLYLRIRELIKNEVAMEVLYKDLARQLSKNKSTDKTASITAEMETKLKQVIAFIKENYRSDISREGLARAVDISPDHMSRSFKQFTGKRILDYINELRIKETEEKLRTTDRKIIDIAFESGFDNLASFNRIFYKIHNVSPSRYRELSRKDTDKN